MRPSRLTDRRESTNSEKCLGLSDTCVTLRRITGPVVITPRSQQLHPSGTQRSWLRGAGLSAYALALTSVASMPDAAQAAGLINVRSFQGTSLSANSSLTSGNGFIPPDTMGAIGLSQYLETSNGSISIYDRFSGNLQSRVTMATFWSAVSPNLSNSLGDQRVLFDHYTNRWIVTGFGATRNVINIAISDTSDALGSWQGVIWNALGSGATADYATLAMDDKGVYLGTNNFNSSSSFTAASVFVLSKKELFDGSPTLVGQVFSGSAAFTIQGAVNWQGNPTATANLLFTDLNSAAGSSISRIAVSGVGTSPTLQSLQINAVTFSTSSFANAKARQPNGTQVIETLDSRLTANIYQANGRLYGVRTVTPDSSPGVAGTSTGLQWFVLNASSGALIESGFIGGDGYDYFQPSIAVNAWGEAVIGYNRSGGAEKGVNGNISVFAQAFRTDPLGGLDAWGNSLLLRQSATDGYNLSRSSGRFRWGDYSAVSLDPLDSRSFWLIGEFAPASDNWATSISYLQLQPVPGPLPLLGLGSGFLWCRRLRRRIARAQRLSSGGRASLAAAGTSDRPRL